MCIPTHDHKMHQRPKKISAIEVGTGLSMRRAAAADDCILCGRSLPSSAQVAKPGTDICDDCLNGPRAA